MRYASLVKNVPAPMAGAFVEIQLPFSRRAARFILFRASWGTGLRELRASGAIAACEGGACLVSETDLSHYHLTTIQATDKVFAWTGWILSIRTGLPRHSKAQMRGLRVGPVLTLMLAARKMGHSAQRCSITPIGRMSPARGAEGGRHMARRSTEEASGRKEKTENPRGAGTDLGYSREEKETLRELAYHAIRSRCLGEPMPEIPVGSQKLMEPRGAFVCIHKGADLRGCIGVIESRDPLGETIKKMAVEAAFGDPRFCALAPDEMDGSTSKYPSSPRSSGIRAFRHRGRKHGSTYRRGFTPAALRKSRWNKGGTGRSFSNGLKKPAHKTLEERTSNFSHFRPL